MVMADCRMRSQTHLFKFGLRSELPPIIGDDMFGQD